MIPKTLFLTRLVFLLSITLVIELIGLPQPVTGPFINFMLIVTTQIVSATGGAVLGCVTPALAVLRGQLPPPLAPMVPFIILANALFVITFAAMRSHQPTTVLFYYLRNGLAIVAAASIKFIVLYLTARFLLPLLLGKPVSAALVSLMALPQWLTALIGGWLALVFYRFWLTKIKAAHR